METFERLLTKDMTPTDELVENTIGKKNISLWGRIKEYLNHAYQINPDLLFYGKKYGWCYRYRKSNKTLCTLFPEKDAFTILITLGKKELEKLEPDFKTLSKKTQDLINSAHQYHDGKWLWVRIPNVGKVEDIKTILTLKRKPKL